MACSTLQANRSETPETGRKISRFLMSSHATFSSLASWKQLWEQQRWVRCGILVLFLVLWARVLWSIYSDTGLFWWLGQDFASIITQSTVFWSVGPSAIYRVDALNPIHQQLLSTYANCCPNFDVVVVPYPPLFAWMFTPFTMLPPPIGFALWENLTLLAALYLAWRVTQFFPKIEQSCAALMLLTSFPIAVCFVVGNPQQLLVACAIAECYLSLRAGRDFRAGLWLACLLIKPQYGFLLGLLLIWKCRWRAVAGTVVGGVIIVGGAVLVGGMAALLAYPSAIIDNYGARFRGYGVGHMTNWRSLVLYFSPEISNLRGMVYTQFLAAATVLCAALAWRGPWEPRNPRFPTQMTVLLLATILAIFHSFNYGATILAIPIAAMLTEGRTNRVARLAVMAGVILPTLSFTLIYFRDGVPAARILTVVLLICYGSLVMELWLARQADPTPKVNQDTKV